jgi:hypothetical protein
MVIKFAFAPSEALSKSSPKNDLIEDLIRIKKVPIYNIVCRRCLRRLNMMNSSILYANDF